MHAARPHRVSLCTKNMHTTAATTRQPFTKPLEIWQPGRNAVLSTTMLFQLLAGLHHSHGYRRARRGFQAAHGRNKQRGVCIICSHLHQGKSTLPIVVATAASIKRAFVTTNLILWLLAYKCYPNRLLVR